MVQKLSGKKVFSITPESYNKNHYIVIGSILAAANEYSNIWGSGLMFATSKLKLKPKKVYAVRGPKREDSY